MELFLLTESTNQALAEAKAARAQLSKVPGRMVGDVQNPPAGMYLENYAQCLLNRQIDIFDDAIFLLDNNRFASACSISRGLVETYASAKFIGDQIEKILLGSEGQKSVDECLEFVVKAVNSSRLKQSEQEKIAKGVFEIEDYQFTEQAAERMRKGLASSVHVLKALRSLYQAEVSHTGRKESHFEFLYDALSEWVHPSQTSIFHQYTPETHLIPTSFGDVHLFDCAKMNCVKALHFITDSFSVHTGLLELAAEITRRDENSKGRDIFGILNQLFSSAVMASKDSE